MKKKLIIPTSILLIITAIMLVVTIFKLYTEAEKVQKSIFASEVLSAGEEIVGKIDAVLKGDTLPVTIESLENKNDSTPAVYHKYSKKIHFGFDFLQTNRHRKKHYFIYCQNNIYNRIRHRLF